MICESKKNKIIVKIPKELEYYLNEKNDIKNIIEYNKNLTNNDYNDLKILENIIKSLNYDVNYIDNLFLENELYNYIEDSLLDYFSYTYQKYIDEIEENKLFNFTDLNNLINIIKNDDIDYITKNDIVIPEKIIRNNIEDNIENNINEFYNLIKNKPFKNFNENELYKKYTETLNNFIKNKLSQNYKTNNEIIDPIIIFENEKYYTPDYNYYIPTPNDFLYEIKNIKNLELESFEIYDYYNNNVLENKEFLLDQEEIKKDILHFGSILNELGVDINSQIEINDDELLIGNIYGFYGKKIKLKTLKIKLNYKIKGLDLFENLNEPKKINKNRNYEIKNIIIKIWKNG